MMFQRQPLTVAILAASLGLVACNSNDHDTPISTSTPTATTTVTVTPSLGKILSGRVVLRDAKTGVDLAPPKTLTPADNGVATFTVPVAKLAAPVIAAVLPTTAGKLEYADEALEKATTITVPVADANKPVLRAAASVSPNANIGVTALTESAVQQAEKAVGGLIAQNINQANAAVKNALNLEFNITQAPIAIGVGEFDKLVNTALDAQRRAYAAYLATLAKEAQRMNSASLAPAYDMAKVLAGDLSDGTFDAKQDATTLSFYNATFVNAWINWVQNFYSSFAQLSNIVALNRWYGGFNIADKNSVTSFPDATPIRTENGIEEYACSGEGRIKSSTGASIYMDFVNQRGSNMNVYWLDYNTGRVSYRPNLATGQTHNQQTFVTHPWLITDNSGACVGIYRPVTASKKTITFKANEVILAGVAAPVDTGNSDTCASKGLPSGQLTNLSDFVGNYNVTLGNNAASTFTIEATGKSTLNGQIAQFKEVCGPNVQNNGTNFVLITDKANVTLFKDTANVITAEGADFTTPANDFFFGTKTQVTDPLKPIRTINGVEQYSCDSWGKIGNGTADGTPTLSFVNQLGANTSLELSGLSSINRTTLIFGGLQNTATYKDPYKALKNQFVRISKGSGECVAVVKAISNDDKTITVTSSGIDVTNTLVANNCSSQGADDKLGFTNAPNDFCGFTKVTSTAITNPDTYNFFNADKKENVEVTVVNNAVTSVSIENDKYGFACGVGSFPACSGVTLNTVNTNTTEFLFNNTALSVVNGASQGITVKNGSLIHTKAVTPPATATCTGNTNPFGCLTITGVNGATVPAAIFEHSRAQNFVNNGLPVNSLTASGVGSVIYRHPQAGSFTEDSIFKVTVDGLSTYNYQEYDASLSPIKMSAYECAVDTQTKLCPNVTHNPVSKEFVFDGAIYKKVGSAESIKFTGIVKY